MKKILAATLALVMTAAVMASCGSEDSSSKANEESKADASSAAAESKAESKADAASATGDESNSTPKDVSEIPSALNNQETASFKFTKDMDPADFVKTMNNSNYEDDESQVKLSIEELEGIPMLRVETLDKNEAGDYKVPKIQIDMSKLFKGQESELPKIFTIKADIIYKAVGAFHDEETGEDKMNPGNFLGKFITQPDDGKGSNSWNELQEFSFAEWVSEWGYAELQIRPGIKEQAVYKDSTKAQYLSLMKWSIPNQADYYIANLTFLDEEGNVIPCNYGK